MGNLSKANLDYILRWEGGLSKHERDSASRYPVPDGSGYHTNKGITWRVFSSIHGTGADAIHRFYQMSQDDFREIYKLYWNGVKADRVESQVIAEYMADFAWGSGVAGASRQIQKWLNTQGFKVAVDGKIGNQTIGAINELIEDKGEKIAFEQDSFDYVIKNGRIVDGTGNPWYKADIGIRGGKIVEGFKLGNSPFDYMNTHLKGKKIVFTTTNGTRTISAVKGYDKILFGAFVNLEAVAEMLLRLNKDVVIVCAGWENEVNLEDTLYAGSLIDKLLPDFTTSGDPSMLAYKLHIHSEGNFSLFLKSSSHILRLQKLGLQKDIDFCLSLDKFDGVPEMFDGEISLSIQ